MKQLTFFALCLMLAFNASGQETTESLPKIMKISIQDAAKVRIVGGTEEGRITFEGSIKPYKVRNGVLEIGNNAKVTIEIGNLNQVEMEDASKLTMEGGAGKGFELIVNDVSQANIDADLENVSVESNDASSVDIRGTAKSLHVNANDASSVRAGELKADVVIARSYDAAYIKVKAVKSIDTQINDVSRIETIRSPDPSRVDSTVIEVNDIKITIEDESKKDTSYDMDWDKKKIKWRPRSRIWAGFEMSIVGLSEEAFGFKVNARDSLWKIDQPSVSLHLNFFEHRFKLGTEYLTLLTGLGYQVDFLRLQENVNLVNSAQGVNIQRVDNIPEYKKNTLLLQQLNIPVLLNINTSPGTKKNFHIDGGVIIGYRFKQTQVQKWDESFKTEVEMKARSNYHQNQFNLAGTVRLGFNGWSVFGIYGLNDLYKKDKGPDFNVWNIGVTLIPF